MVHLSTDDHQPSRVTEVVVVVVVLVRKMWGALME